MSDTQSVPNSNLAGSSNGALHVVSLAARQGAADASEAAARTWTATGRFLNRFVYTTCYTISYGVVFSSTLLARSVPHNNCAVRGIIEGAHDARIKVDTLRQPAVDAPSAALAPA